MGISLSEYCESTILNSCFREMEKDEELLWRPRILSEDDLDAIAGINDEVHRGDKLSPKRNFITFHTARRSGTTNLYLSGVCTNLIADLGGWTNEKTLKVSLRASGLDSAYMASDLEFFK